jgi:alanine dehydrogenase
MVTEQSISNFSLSSQLIPKEEKLAFMPKKASLTIALLKENDDTERRVCLSPEAVGLLVQNGHTLLVERDAGLTSHYQDVDYSNEGAKIVEDKEILLKAGILLKVSALNNQESNHSQKIKQSLQRFSFYHAIKIILRN